MQNRTYPSRIDAWLLACIGLALGLPVLEGFAALPRAPAEALLHFAVPVLLLALGRLLGYPCAYTLTPTHLLIRAGVVRQRIPYSDITGIEPSHSLWAAPALSLRRVKISRKGRFHLVSPREREAFMEELGQRVAAARQDGRPLPTGNAAQNPACHDQAVP